MQKKLFAAILMTASFACAADEADTYLQSGAPGLPMETADPSEFRVCAPRENLPFSDEKGEGFENKIAEVLAKDLGKKLKYMYWYDRQGFYRNTLNANRCDVVIGTASDADITLNSKPYYRSGYVFVYKKDSGLDIKNWDSPDLRKAKIGLVGQTPPSVALAEKDLLGNTHPYRLQRDLNLPPSHIVDDLVKGDIDVAIVWGPIGGYYAKKYGGLTVVPVPEYAQDNARGKEYFNISVGVRKKDKERLAQINAALERRQKDIEKILDDYGIPHVPVVSDKPARLSSPNADPS